jgi:hypothetical protein
MKAGRGAARVAARAAGASLELARGQLDGEARVALARRSGSVAGPLALAAALALVAAAVVAS